MTLQSSQGTFEVEVLSRPSNSTQTSSIYAFPLPSFLEQEKIISNGEQMSLVQNDENLLSNINIEGSTQVRVGNTNETIINNIYKNYLLRHLKFSKASWQVGTSTVLIVFVFAISLFFICERSADQFTKALPNDSYITEVFINRTMWGGKQPLYIKRTDSASLIIVKHTGGKICFDFKSCSKRVREIQKYNMEVQKMPDIEYNFLIGGDGRIYVGRDWYVQNEDRPKTIDIAFIGNFTENIPTTKMIKNTRQLIIFGYAIFALNFQKLTVVCHNQTEKTDSPGKNLFMEVTSWMEYSNETAI